MGVPPGEVSGVAPRERDLDEARVDVAGAGGGMPPVELAVDTVRMRLLAAAAVVWTIGLVHHQQTQADVTIQV